MPYRQNASLPSSSNPSSGSGSGSLQTRYTNPVRAEDLDNGGTNSMHHAKATCIQDTLADTAFFAPDNLNPNANARKGPSSFVMNSTSSAAPKRESGDHVTSTSTLATRRRQSSIPGVKGPMGPRPLDFGSGTGTGTGKRYHSTLQPQPQPWFPEDLLTPAFLNLRTASNSINPQFNSLRGASAVASQDPYTNELSINDISRFSFASIQTKPSSNQERDATLDFGNFLEPTFNFDDFQDTIVGTEPSLNHFPLPGRGGSIKIPTASTTASASASTSATPDSSLPELKKPPAQAAIPIPARKGSGITPITRKSSTASNTSRNSAKSDSMSTSTTSILRGRRQSHFPPNSFNNAAPAAKAPRKSVGPGTFVAPESSDKPGVKRRPSVGGRKSSTESTKSLQLKTSLGPKRRTSKDLLTPSRTPDHLKTSSGGNPNTPTRRSGTPGRTTTPGGNADRNRRMSVMPHHATGLGARTVSPTDARRMKRMSIVPPAPPLPQSRISQAPPTPLPDPVPQMPQSDIQSPVVPSRKSLTPSSSRTTPDPNRKSYSSGQSLSSNTSYSSVRNNANNPARLPLNPNSSRLPTPKPRLDTSGNTTFELEVPPVPAIPKAYESPGSEHDQPFFSARSSSLPPFDGVISASPVVSTLADAMKALETPRAPSTSSHVSSHQPLLPTPTLVPIEPELKTRPQRKSSKKNLQTLRLPPLNLLPLSTPTAAKIKSFNSKIEPSEGTTTPPGVRGTMKTPSTPMTASKATFFSQSHKGASETILRSSTSHHALRSDELRPPSGISPNLPAFTFETGKSDRNLSPFVSSSLPKSADDFSTYMRPNFITELSRNPSHAKPNGPRAPSFSVTPKMEVAASPVSAERPAESESVFSTSVLRRKLSRKRSETQVLESAAQNDDLRKYDNMPPPKLPASSTWTNPQNGGSSPSQKPSYLRSRRQTSTSSIPVEPKRQESHDSSTVQASTARPSADSSRTLMMHTNRSGSLSASTPNLVGKQQSHRQQEPVLDRDDMIAEEEMKKLASKRKDAESAARQLDALRARARPVRRMSAETASHTFELNLFERGEIVDHPNVYFTGTAKARKIIGDLNAASSNFGYDDERGDYNIVEGDHLAYRYEVVDLLGKGSFGQVVRCVDHKTGILVAVKIIRNKKRFHQQALVEVNILQKLKEWVSHSAIWS